MHAEDQDAQLGPPDVQAMDEVKPAHVGHAHVGHDRVDPAAAHFSQCMVASGCLSDRPWLLRSLKDTDDAFAHDGVIVDDEDLQCGAAHRIFPLQIRFLSSCGTV